MLKIWTCDTSSCETYTESKLLDASLASALSPLITKCQSLKKEKIVSSISIEVTSEHPPTDFFICFRLHIVSQAIKELIQSFENVKVEFYPVKVFVLGEKYLHENYFFMHIVDKVNCFDSVKSEYKSHQVKSSGATIIDSINKLVLQPVNTEEHRLFRIGEVSFFILCVDAIIASRLADAGLTGVVFLEPSETYW